MILTWLQFVINPLSMRVDCLFFINPRFRKIFFSNSNIGVGTTKGSRKYREFSSEFNAERAVQIGSETREK